MRSVTSWATARKTRSFEVIKGSSTKQVKHNGSGSFRQVSTLAAFAEV